MSQESWPAVAAVIPTHNRPELVRRAIDAVCGQDYPGEIHVVVVFDRSEPDRSLERRSAGRRVEVIGNTRNPGLCGARNSGILATDAEFVAFCDDDDEWLPGKLRAQVAALAARPEAEFAATSIVVDYDGRSSVRLAGRDEVTHADLLRSRMAMLHSSTFLAKRAALTCDIGLLDEDIPGGMREDWEILLRASRRHPIVHVDRPLVRVLWGSTSYFDDRWHMKIAAHEWMLRRHPDIAASPIGVGRVYGQMAFYHAALRRRRDAVRWAAKALRANPREPRAALAVAVAARVLSAQAVLRQLHKRGHGI
ncbi:MAG: glycosyltransferase [Streptosporangiales bacterium]|nr:glycosyltransferase [Streptosporangiales bacterium]